MQQLNTLVCIFHSSDYDGHGSAAIVRSHARKSGEFDKEFYFPLNYNGRIPWNYINEFTTVVMVDIGFSPSIMEEINNKCKKFIWIDHHYSAIKANKTTYEGLRMSAADKSAIYLTWQYFFKDKAIPRAVKLLSDYDVWRNDDKQSWEQEVLPFQYGLRRYKLNARFDTPLFHKLFANDDECDRIISEGKHIVGYILGDYERIANNSSFVYRYKDKYNMLCVNYAGGTFVFDSMYDPTKHDIMLMFQYKAKYNAWAFSIYTYKNDIDVATIAESYGGGGHKDAAGFNVARLSDFFPDMVL